MNIEASYMGLRLKSPVVASASSLSYTLDGVRRLAASGVGAIVMHSLFEEEITGEADRRARLLEAGTESYAESLSYFPEPTPQGASKRHLDLLERAASLSDVPVIGSLNATAPGGWVAHAQEMESAGAAGIELNVYMLPASPQDGGRSVEARHVELLQMVKSAVRVPVAVKLGPFFSSIGEVAAMLDAAGADGLVLFARFVHPDIDPELMRIVPGIGLSSPFESRLSRTWISLLRGKVRASIAGATGVDQAEDVIKYLLAGADVVMTASSLLRHGPAHAQDLVDGVSAWMARKGFQSLADFRGMLSGSGDGDGAAEERAAYVDALRAANAKSQGPW